MNKKKKLWVIIAIIIAVAIIGGAVYLSKVSRYQAAVKNITIDNIELANVADGVYIGECNVNFISAKVQVTVSGGKIERLELIEHKNDRGAPAEAITGKIIEAQSLDVDTIAGATNSCKVIKKAIENALKK